MKKKKELVIKALKQLQCLITEAKENPNELYIVFQAYTFHITLDDDPCFITIDDGWFYDFPSTDIEKLSKVKNVVNTVNWNSHTTVNYHISPSTGKVHIHTRVHQPCFDTMEMNVRLYQVFCSIFETHYRFFKALAEVGIVPE